MNNIQIKNKTFRAVLLVVLSVMFAVFGASFFGSYQKTETLNVEQETVYAALSGSGTADSPYTISSPAQMVEFAGLVNGGNSYSGKYFILTADIDLSGKVWTPIGDKPSSGTAHPFAGIFDGNGCTITGLTINMTLNVPCYGLFGYVKGSSASNRAIIRNVKLEGVNINGSSASYSGAVVGYAENAYILDCSSAGNVTSSGSYSVGGVLGYSGSNVTVKGCYSYASVKSGSYAGGIVGRTASSSTIAVKQCFFGGNLTGSASYTGGIVGSAGSSIIINDVFGGDYGYKGGTSTKYVVTDKANWITDVTDKNGNTLMSYYVTIDSSKKVLKGVGNIVVAYKNYQFQSGAYNTTTPVDKQEALLYSLTSKNTANDASATTTLDNSCNLYSEKSQTTITKSNYTFSKITLSRVNGAASKTAFASAKFLGMGFTCNDLLINIKMTAHLVEI